MNRRGALSMSLVMAMALLLHLKPVEPLKNSLKQPLCFSSNNSEIILGHCSVQLILDLQQSQDQVSRRNAYCCAISAFRTCILSKMGSQCGDNSQKVAEITNQVVKLTKFAKNGVEPCGENEYYYQAESPLCWSVWGQGAALMFIVLFLFVCCVTCC